MAVVNSELLSVSFSRELSEVVVSLAGDLYAQSARILADRLTDVIDQQGNLAVVVNLEAVDHVDSPGIGVLVDASRRLRSKGGYLAVLEPLGGGLRDPADKQPGQGPHHPTVRGVAVPSQKGLQRSPNPVEN